MVKAVIEDPGYGDWWPPSEPTAFSDFLAERMREYFDFHKPKGFFARRREESMLAMGCADGIMIGLQNVVAHWERKRPK